jgi:uncharacterized protein (DUF169 family)
MNIPDCNEIGKELIDGLRLRFSPIAFKLIFNEEEIPENSMLPFLDTGNRPAMCQAFSLVRRNRKAITMLKDDHWCLWPLACLKTCQLDEDDFDMMGSKLFMKDPEKGRRFLKEQYPWLESSTPPLGFTLAPLESCGFVPDVIVIYCRVAQLRSLIMAAKYQESEMWAFVPDPIVSCCYATIPLLNGKNYNITIPDPGEYERGLVGEDEIVFSLRGDRLENLMEGVRTLGELGFDYMGLQYDMNYNFPRAQFYNDMFAKWGLATGESWKPGER